MESGSTFDPRRFVTRVGGADYLEVKWRVYWLRTMHPDAVITTELQSHQNSVAVFKAHVSIPGGGSSTGWGSEGYDDFRDYLEKAETKALGRALAALGFGTQFTNDFDFDTYGEKVVDAPVRLARQRQLVDLAEERRGQPAERQGMTDRQKSFIRQMARDKGLNERQQDGQVQELFGKRFDQMDRRDASAYIERLKSIPDATGPLPALPDDTPPDDLADGYEYPEYDDFDPAQTAEHQRQLVSAAQQIFDAEPHHPAQQQGMDMPRGRGYPSDDQPQQDRMSERQKGFLLQLLEERNVNPEDLDAAAQMETGAVGFDQMNRRQASEWIERLTGKKSNPTPTVNERIDARQNAQNAPQRTEAAQTGQNTPQAGPGDMTDKQKGKIWFDAKEKLQADADSPEFNDLMVLRYGKPLPGLTKAQASEVIKLLAENPRELQAQLPKNEQLRDPAAGYWLNRVANAASPIEAAAIRDMIRGRYSQIEKPYGEMLTEELKRWGVE